MPRGLSDDPDVRSRQLHGLLAGAERRVERLMEMIEEGGATPDKTSGKTRGSKPDKTPGVKPDKTSGMKPDKTRGVKPGVKPHVKPDKTRGVKPRVEDGTYDDGGDDPHGGSRGTRGAGRRGDGDRQARTPSLATRILSPFYTGRRA